MPRTCLAVSALVLLAGAGCAAPSVSPSASASAAVTPVPADALDGAGWFVADLEFDPTQPIVTGYRLSVGTLGDPEPRAEVNVDLAVWDVELGRGSVVSGPARGRVVYVADDGAESSILVADVSGEVGREVAAVPEVVWALEIAPNGEDAYAVLVDRATAADRGVWRFALDGGRPAEQVLAPSPRAAAGSGSIRLVAVRRFIREIRVSSDSTLLVRRACGEPFGSCDLDVLALADGRVRTFRETPVVDLLGIGGDLVVGGSDCPGRCFRSALEVSSGAMLRVAVSDGRDTVVLAANGHLVLLAMEDVQTGAGIVALRATDLENGASWLVGEPSDDIWYTWEEPGRGNVELPAGWALISQKGRPAAVRLDDGQLVPIDIPSPTVINPIPQG